MSDDLRIIHFNTQGFQNKISNINSFVKVHKPDILVLTEHFQKNASDLEQIDGYKMVNSFCRKHNERGGVAIWAKDNIPCSARKDLDKHRKEKEFELVSVSVGKDIVVTGAYRPPSTSIPEFHVNLDRFIKKINQEPHLKHVLTGDFNIDNSRPNKTRDVLEKNDLMFHITSMTHKNGRCIDNFITNFDTASSRVIKSKISNFSDHHPIEIIVSKKANMISKRADSFLYKMFKKMFEKKTAELRESTSPKQKPKEEDVTSSPRVYFYDIFSKVFDKMTGKSAGSESNPPNNGRKLKLPRKKKAKFQTSQSSNPPSIFSKLISFIMPWWLKPSHFQSSSRARKPQKSKSFEIKPTSSVNSIFSVIGRVCSFIFGLLKSTSTHTA